MIEIENLTVHRLAGTELCEVVKVTVSPLAKITLIGEESNYLYALGLLEGFKAVPPALD